VDYRFPPALEGSLFSSSARPTRLYKGFMVLVAVASLAGLVWRWWRTRAWAWWCALR
jgi:hypothetical protein